MSERSPVKVVAAFHDHLARRDVDALVALAADDVQVGGPRGTGEGTDLLREWVARANVTFRPLRWFAKDDLVVVEQDAVWHDAAGEETDRRVLVTTFRVDAGGKLAGIERHDELAAALTLAGLDAGDEIDAP